MEAQQVALQKLQRQQSTLASQHSLTVSSYNPTSHASDILKLDTEKFRVAKQASDLEIEGERLANELEAQRGLLGELEAQGSEGGEAAWRSQVNPDEDEIMYGTLPETS